MTHSVLGWTPGCASPVVSLLRQGRLPLSGWPRPLGLVLGLSAVAVGQLATLLFFYYRREIRRGRNRLVQQLPADAPPPYDFWEGVRTHLAQPEGFLLLGSYLSLVSTPRATPLPRAVSSAASAAWPACLQSVRRRGAAAATRWREQGIT